MAWWFLLGYETASRGSLDACVVRYEFALFLLSPNLYCCYCCYCCYCHSVVRLHNLHTEVLYSSHG